LEIESVSVQAKKEKSPNWTNAETLILVSEVKAQQDVLMGKFRGAVGGVSCELKQDNWASISAAVSAAGNQVRTVRQCKEKWRKTRSETKGRRRGRSATGGGPPPPSMKAALREVSEIYKDCPSFNGIAGGMDTLCEYSENSRMHLVLNVRCFRYYSKFYSRQNQILVFLYLVFDFQIIISGVL
jgi:hypothetical protein